MDMNLSKLWEVVKDGEVWCAAVPGVTESDMTLGLKNKNTLRKQNFLWKIFSISTDNAKVNSTSI